MLQRTSFISVSSCDRSYAGRQPSTSRRWAIPNGDQRRGLQVSGQARGGGEIIMYTPTSTSPLIPIQPPSPTFPAGHRLPSFLVILQLEKWWNRLKIRKSNLKKAKAKQKKQVFSSNSPAATRSRLRAQDQALFSKRKLSRLSNFLFPLPNSSKKEEKTPPYPLKNFFFPPRVLFLPPRIFLVLAQMSVTSKFYGGNRKQRKRESAGRSRAFE